MRCSINRVRALLRETMEESQDSPLLELYRHLAADPLMGLRIWDFLSKKRGGQGVPVEEVHIDLWFYPELNELHNAKVDVGAFVLVPGYEINLNMELALCVVLETVQAGKKLLVKEAGGRADPNLFLVYDSWLVSTRDLQDFVVETQMGTLDWRPDETLPEDYYAL